MNNILSVKIVTADYYNSYPIPNLDVTHSQFRKKDVKTCSVIRIFGITKSNKKKICCNIHNVFPYIFCPCPEIDVSKIDKMMKEMAEQIDQQLNASFGQTNSKQIHVHNITICKGIPYYGFHSSEHKFFRIELYNPNLIKRTAGLLLSGNILGKMLQPHESHIPYILRFFIDFNLFGMSYLHVPLNKIHTRSGAADSRHKKRSVSEIEIDFSAVYILNRTELAEDISLQKKAANIGIESIWEDERKRRQQAESQDMPELRSVEEESRTCSPTSSDQFFQNALKERFLTETKTDGNDTSTNDSSEKTVKIKFDLKIYLDKSAYATEVSQSSSSSSKDLNLSMNLSQTIEELENHFICTQETQSSVNDVIHSASQKENSDYDSILAPLSKSQASTKTNKCDDLHEVNCEEIDDDDYSEFNMTLADLEAAILHDDSNDTNIPQLDGIDDEIKVKIENDVNFEAGPSNMPPASSDFQQHLRNLMSHFGHESKPYQDSDGSDDEQMKSFYDQTLLCDDFESNSSGSSGKEEQMSVNNDENCIIALSSDPPSPENVLEHLQYYNIPMTEIKQAFYGNPLDVTEKREIGHNILHIRSNRLNDCDDFKSVLYDKSQIHFHQMQKFSHDFGFFPKKNLSTFTEVMDSYSVITLHPIDAPPTYEDAKNWLQSKIKSNVDDKVPTILDDSPVKIKRAKTLMVLDETIDEKDFDDTTLIPQTPDEKFSPIVQNSLKNNYDSTSLSEYIEDGIYLSHSARKKKKRKTRNNFSERFQEIMKAKLATSIDLDNSESSMSFHDSEKLSDSSEDTLVKNSQSSSIKLSDDTYNSSIIQDANITFAECSDTFSGTYDFKMKLESLQSTDEHNDLTILSMELFAQNKLNLNPNPETDEISAIFFTVDGYYVNEKPITSNGIIAVVDESSYQNLGYFNYNIDIIKVNTEMELLEEFFKKIRIFDPDIFAGYEIELQSWGYLFERGFVLNMNFCNALSRMPLEKGQKPKMMHEEDENDQGDYFSEQKIPGRILLDVWRLMRHEIALTSYSFENIAYHILHRRYPKHSYDYLTAMWNQPLRRWIVFEYYMTRAKVLLEILNQLDLISRTCELAKLFGIQFFEVLSRGSQFRVESMMLRIAKRRNYVPVSPSVQQRANMRAPEYIPLILEPESRFYTDPVIVLDFQSLYPSMIIAYNYCFSTCLGRVEHLMKGSFQPFEFGAYQLRIPPTRLEFFLKNDLITVSPNGVAFIKSSIREGVLPRMLKEILDTRLMVKQSMKLYKNNTALQRVLHSRQLGLKLIANVTYGYTAANFSGRMPAIEVGDSVVSKGRETLERAINMVEKNEKWKCKVCYGDTDSMFVLVPGRTREEAFKIGKEIAEAVTNDNPHPVKLKLEKVYQPCILQTKKRYVGNMYENADQIEPIFEAKGIETIRRDGSVIASKILEKSLKILFDTYNISKVKDYVCRQFLKIMEGKINIQDLIIAKEFRGTQGYKEKAVVPALTLARKWKQTDPRNEPRRGERVPFILTNGPPNSTLIRLVKSPLEVLNDESLKINTLYYITKSIIPPLNRCFLLIGVNVHEWFSELPKKCQSLPISSSHLSKKSTISQFFNTKNCAICDKQCEQIICDDCKENPQISTLLLNEKMCEIERKFTAVRQICQACCKRSFNFKCISLDCPTLYSLTQINRDFQKFEHYRGILNELI